MRDYRINYALVGLFVLLMLGALVGALALLTGRTGPTETYYAVFENVSGIGYGTQVLYEGYPIGQVSEIQPSVQDGEMQFRVVMSLRADWYIPEDSVATISASGLLSAVVVEIRGGSEEEAVKPGGTIAAAPGGNVLSAMNNIAAEVTDLSENSVRPLLANINTQVDRLGTILETDAPRFARALADVTEQVAESTPTITGNLEAFSASLRRSGERLDRVLGEENLATMSDVLARLDNAARNLETASAGLARVMSEGNARRVDTILTNFEATSRNVAQLSADLQATRERLDAVMAGIDTLVSEGGDDLRRTLNDLQQMVAGISRSAGAITSDLEGTSRNLREFSRQVRQNPSVLLGGTEAPEAMRR